MDRLKSIELEKRIKNKIISGFKVLKLINNGKSAAVFKAEKGSEIFALKIFDNEMVERFGHEIQIKRITQEISLKNHEISNLVKIYEGGSTIVDNEKYYFIVMEFISGLNLKDFILNKTYDQSFIIKVLDRLVGTSNELLSKGVVHRDIKPENVMVDDDGEIILMDLGVLKLIGAKSFSDEEEKAFVGTLRYAPPEFLVRAENDSDEGWKAVNIYQIGAILHDLIMEKELFFDKIPYTNLVIAIKDDVPLLSNSQYSFELLQITRDMLTKDWSSRLKIVDSGRINKLIISPKNSDYSFEKEIDDLMKTIIKHTASFDEIERLTKTKKEQEEKRHELGQKLLEVIDLSFTAIKEKGIFNSYKKSRDFHFSNDSDIEKFTQNYVYLLDGDLKMGFPKDLHILIRISNNDSGYIKINALGLFLEDGKILNLHEPQYLCFSLDRESRTLKNSINRAGPPVINFSFETISIFEGTVNIDDSFKNHISINLVKLIKKALIEAEEIVEKKLSDKRNYAGQKTPNWLIKPGVKNAIVINTL